MPHRQTRLARLHRHRPAFEKPIRSAPSSLVMASVGALVVIWTVTFSIEVRSSYSNLPRIDLPILEASPVQPGLEDLFLTVTTTDKHGREPGGDHVGAVRSGNCRVFLGNGHLVSSEELYDAAFSRLDVTVQVMSGVEPSPDQVRRPPPPVLLQADAKAPWQCVAGVIYIVQAAGYEKVKFLTTPVA